MDKGDPVHVFQQLPGLHQPGDRSGRQVDLGHVAGNHRLGAESQAGQKHHHLLGSGVLGLVQDHEGVVQGAAPHESQGGHLNDAPLHQARGLLEIHHVVEGVVQRPEIGVDLLRQVAGQEAQLLPGLHRRPGQHDADELLVHQGGHGHGHGQVGLAGAGRPHPEDDIVGADGFDVAFLVEALGGDAPLHGGHEDRVQEDVLDGDALLVLQDLDGVLDVLGDHRVAGGQQFVEFQENPLGQADVRFLPGQVHLVAPHLQFYPQTAADDLEILAVLAVEGLGQSIVRQGELGPGGGGGSHGGGLQAFDGLTPITSPRMWRNRGRLSKSSSTICCQVPNSSCPSSTGMAREGLRNAARTWA